MTKPKISPEDIELFRSAVKNVKPLKASATKAALNKPAKLPKRVNLKPSTSNKIIANELSDHLRETVTGDQKLFFAQPGLPAKLLRELRQGKIKQQGILDLHGYTVEQARTALVKRLAACIKRDIRCLRIIHGKGRLQSHDQPIIKNQINNWLQQHNSVLAFCSALPADGGTGAVYVLLKRNRTTEDI